MGIPQARDMDRVTCGRYPGMFIIVGGVPETDIHGRLMAGTLDFPARIRTSSASLPNPCC
ncbi:hypothetical protein [Escherichia coli]|uniref:hypothetical protein n=1 Tax=Escherichia coli TaxID=562 RepID=UPI0013895A1F|nr:hypothetical protein [Escherichia coli]